MKHLKLSIVFAMLICTLQVYSLPGDRILNLNQAFNVVKKEFSNQDINYFLCKNYSQYNPAAPSPLVDGQFWVFFVDPFPEKGWTHEAYIVKFSKKNPTTNMDGDVVPEKILVHIPPTDTLIKMSVKNQYGSNAKLKPSVPVSQSLSNANNENHYAIIVSGGVNKNSNYERYWNDCSFIYQTLVNKYRVPKENIIPLISDGNDPQVDMFKTDYTYANSSLDLDFDGTNEVELSATKTNVVQSINNISAKIKSGDHLLIYVTDHGGSDDYLSKSYICLWGSDKIYDHELAALLSPLCKKGVIVNAILGQCFSGGFIDDLEQAGCVVATASTGMEYSWACATIPYDEFLYHWTSALNGADAHGKELSADKDNDGNITMREAFEFAISKDIMDESPQYSSSPLYLGKELSFNNIPSPTAVFIRDGLYDTGIEPSGVTEFWNSPDIWTRNNDDWIEEHENPYYAQDHLSAVIYVRVHNRGWLKHDKTHNDWLHTYWAKASTGLTSGAWKGRELYNFEEVTGGHMGGVNVGDLNPGESKLLRLTWGLPLGFMDDMADDAEEHHFCLLARILNSPYDDKYEAPAPGEPLHYDVVSDRRAAQKNVSIIKNASLLRGTKVYIRNVYNTSKSYSLEIRPHSSNDELLFDKAKISMDMSTPIYDAWIRGGNASNDIDYQPLLNDKRVYLKSKYSRVESVIMNDSEFDTVTLRFNFKESSSTDEYYSFDLIQKDDNGNIVGGETFIVYAPSQLAETLEISTDEKDEDVELSTNLSQKGYNFLWLDDKDNVLGTNEKLSLNKNSKEILDGKITAIATSEDGKITKSEINLEICNKISNIAIHNNTAEISLKNPVTENRASIMITSAIDPCTPSVTENLEKGISFIQIDLSSLQSGIYCINYVVDGIIIETKKVSL